MPASQIDQIFSENPIRIIISKPRSTAVQYRKITISRKRNGYQMEKLTQKQAFHENFGDSREELFRLRDRITELMKSQYGQLNAQTAQKEYTLLVSKKGKTTLSSNRRNTAATRAGYVPEKILPGHNRTKEYIFNEGDIILPMVEMGILTKEGKVVRSMYDKFKQINRFAQIVDDVIQDRGDTSLNVIDFGCGKSYLTFILYYYFTEIKHISVTMTGLDLKEDVIAKCNAAAERYGYKGLHFELGDINGYRCKEPVDMVVTLHACDTATDYALFNAVDWGASMIFSVPCCQHELNRQMESKELSILTKYGIIQERTAALFTDAIRASLLEYCGYKTNVMEFVDFAHTPKNLLIRAQKTGRRRRESLGEVRRMMEQFHLEPTLYRLLAENGMIEE